METTELFYPDIRVQLGKYIFSQGTELGVYSSQDSYFDWAKVRFVRQFRDKISLTAREKAVVQLGYNGVFDDVFEGYVSKPYSGSALNEILLKDDMLLLEETLINKSFLNASPQEVLTYCLQKAGVREYRLDSTRYRTKPRFAVEQKDVISVINGINSAWSIAQRFFFQGGVFYWGVKPEQAKVYQFEYGSNIIALNKSAGAWELETVSAPFIKHSQLIDVEHPEVSGRFEVKRIVFTTNEAGFIRTYIYF